MKEFKRGQMPDYIFISFIQPLCNQVDPIETRSLFFKGDLANPGSCKYKDNRQKTQTRAFLASIEINTEKYHRFDIITALK